jgi:amino acid adenylation domain-containing protein
MSSEAARQASGAGAQLLRDRLRRRNPDGAVPPSIIPVARRDGGVPLSFAQRRLWVLDRLRPGGTDYVVPIVLRLRGDLSGLDLPAALEELVRRHEILRTRYTTDRAGDPMQTVDPPAPVPVPFNDLVGAGADALDTLLEGENARPFDLATGPVLRARLIRTAPGEHVLALMLHHIAVDGWSSELLVRELAEICTDASRPAATLQYADFAAWQRTAGPDDAGLRFWADRLRDLPALELPLDHPRPAVWDADGTTVSFHLPAQVIRQATATARRFRATPFMLHLAAFWALLHRYTGQADFAVGTPVAGRTVGDTHGLLGLFVNTLALRADLTDDPTFGELLTRARTTSVEAFARQDVPFEQIVDTLGVGRDLATHPLVGVNLTLQNTEPVRFEAGSVTGEVVPVPARRAKFDLSWTLEERPDGSVVGEATFPYALFDEATIRRMTDHYQRLLAAAVAAPDRRVRDLPLMSDAELEPLVHQPTTPAPAAPCLHERFSEQARRRPGAIALTDDGRHLTYGELEARANQLAHRLRAIGAGREALVGICLPRGADMIVALLASLKAGAAYLPLDPDHPADRIQYLLREGNARILVTSTELAARVSEVADRVPVLLLDTPDEQERVAALPHDPPAVTGHPDDLAYVIFTSGSTGRPKGVQITHANVVRLLTANEDAYRFGPDDVWALFHSYAFDVSVWEIWGTFLYGGRLVVVPYQVSRSPWDLVTLLADEGVTVLNQTPSAFRSLVDLAGQSDATLDRLRLRLVVLAGEAVDIGCFRQWWDRFDDTAPQLVNMYGITETTVHVTYRPLTRADLGGDRSPIGRAMRDMTLYVLDDRMRPVPIGVPGEIYVGGPGVGRGYADRPALTAQRFVPDPFGPAGARLYRSGDKARILANGDIGFLGRFDDQVKIRGFRIELGEVESCLADHPAVDTAVVTVHEPAPGDRRLVGYVVPVDGSAVTVADLRAFVTARLPGYLVPALFMVVARLPLTVNGKVDRRALPAPDAASQVQQDGYVAPRTAEEARMAALWSGVLDTDRVGVHDNFFALGGDSIRAVRLVGLLRAEGFGYSVQDLFRHQSVAALISGGELEDPTAEESGTAPFALLDADDRAALPTDVVDAYPLAQVQSGMIFESLADPDNLPYHNVTSYLIRDGEPFDPAALAAAADQVVADHEILRTSFDLATFSEPLQLVHRRATVECGQVDLRELSADDQQAAMATFRDRERARPFDLGTAPLIRFHAHRVEDDRWFLSLTEFHAILDGWSHNSIVSEVLAAYRAHRAGQPSRTAAERTVRFADHVAQERRSLSGTADREFWRGRLAGTDRLTIPAAWADRDGSTKYPVVVPYHDLEPELRTLAAAAGASVKSVLLTAHLAVWRAVTGGRRFHSGLVCNGRAEVAGGDEVRGMFLNPVPFVAPAGTGTWCEAVRAVFAEEVDIWPHRRFPLPALQRAFGNGERLLEVAFNYLDFHVLDRASVDTSGSTDVSPNEFPFAVSTQGGTLILMIQSARIARRHGEQLARMYRHALELMASDPHGNAGTPLVPRQDRERLIAAGAGAPAAVPDRAVHELVADHARRAPGAVAVQTADGCVTYGELDRRARGWAARLRDAGVRAGDIVGVCLSRDAEWVAAILGVLTVGAAYLPVDPAHPTHRNTAILHQAGVGAVITGADVASHPPDLNILLPAVTDERCDVAVHHPDGEELAYVVHTSGSTGRPKGVMARHRALSDRVASMCRVLRLGPDAVVVGVLPTVTDAAQLGLFVALTSGGRLVLAGEDLARDPGSLAGLLRHTGATFMQASPTTWRMLVESGWSPSAGFRVLSGGESMTASLIGRLRAGGAELWDNYGPSEATVFCFGTRLSGPDSPAWVPAANTATYLLGDDLEPVVDGVPGQVFVGGDGLARGYLGQPRATADAFRPDPFAATPGARMYATGDIGRRTAHGGIAILGRRDHQVKIRGLRIELGEIENALVGQDGVRAAVVHPTPGPRGDLRLAAYVVADAGAADVDRLRAALARLLPAPMVPTFFQVLESFPRLPNGKVDRAALPVPTERELVQRAPSDRPRGAAEEAVAAVWAEELGVDVVDREDDFFTLGGHSLLMLRIIARLSREHGIELTFRDILTHRTVAGVVAASASGRRRQSTALVWLGDSGTRTPLFCVHPGGGSAHWYRDLADTGAAHLPVAAFEWPGLHGGEVQATSVPEVARRYVAELRDARPRGPYLLLGWCASSGIAWEMARRLRADGERTRLILLDPLPEDATRDGGEHVSMLRARIRRFREAEQLVQSLRGTSTPQARQRVREELVTTMRGLVDDADRWVDGDDVGDAWTRRLSAWRTLLEIRMDYRFRPYDGPVELMLSDELVAGKHESIVGRRLDDYVEQWRRLTTGTVRVHRVGGDHLGALRPPHVSGLTAAVSSISDRIEE